MADLTKEEGTYPVADWIMKHLSGGDTDAQASTPPMSASALTDAANFGDKVTGGQFNQPPMTTAPGGLSSNMPPVAPDTGLQDIAASGSLPQRPVPSQAAEQSDPQIAQAISRSISSRDSMPPGLDESSLKDAQALQNKLRFMSQIGQASSNFGSALGHTGPADQTFFDNAQKNASAPVDQLMARRKALMDDTSNRAILQEQDPGSEISMNLRAAYAPMLKKIGLSNDAIQNASAADLKGFFQQPVEAMQKIQAQSDNKQLQMQAMQNNKEIALGEKTDKRFSTLGEALDENKGRTGEFGRQAQIINNADKALVLGKQFADGNLPPAQMAELAGATANLVSGGNGAAEATVHRFVPSTFSGSEAGISQWLSSEPKGAGQQAFVKQLLETAQREKELAASKVNAIKLSRVADYKDLSTKDPQRFDVSLQSHGIDPKDYAEFAGNGYKVPQHIANPLGTGGAQDPKISQWASQHQLPYEQAASILKARGYGG